MLISHFSILILYFFSSVCYSLLKENYLFANVDVKKLNGGVLMISLIALVSGVISVFVITGGG